MANIDFPPDRMSAPPSHDTPQGDDFVLWPDAPTSSVTGVNEVAIRGALAGLAPAEWVAGPEEEATTGSRKAETAGREERFYPASRTWFRTTDALDPGGAIEKWWQSAPASPPAKAETPAREPVAPGHDLLSPEEIWELAAEELAQVSRLGAPAAPAPVAAPVVASALTAPVVAAAPVPAPVVTVSRPEPLDVGFLSVEPRPATGRASPVDLGVVTLQDGAAARAERSVAAMMKALAAPAGPVPDESVGAAETPEIPVRPAVPVASAISPVFPSSPLLPAAAPVEPVAGVEAEPLPVFPALSRPPVALRAESAAKRSTLPTHRRTALPELKSADVFAEVGQSGETDRPHFPAAPTPALETAAEAGPVSGERRRRRHRKERQRTPDSSDSGLRWGRWLAGTVGLVVVAAAVAAIMARDQLPPEWGKSARRWWWEVNALLFPHRYHEPRRGVQARTDGTLPASGTFATGAVAPVALDARDASPPSGRLEPRAASDPLEAGPETARPSLIELPALREEAVGTPAPAAAPPAEMEPGAFEDPGGASVMTAPDAEPAPDAAAAESEAGSPATKTADVAVGKASAAVPGSVETVESAADAFALWDGDEGAREMGAVPGPDGAGGKVAADGPAGAAEVAAGLKAVRGLISATTPEQVLPWIFDAGTLEFPVQNYHAKHPLHALTGAVIEFEYSGVIPGTGEKAHIFNVLHPSHPRGFPVSAESTAQGYRIDWQSYIQWRDGWLQRFLEKKPSEPQTLFVVLRRTHYFNDDVPKLDEKLAFKLTSAVPGDEGAVAFVDKNSAVGRSLGELYEWRTLYFPVVELQWEASGKAGAYLRLNRIVRPTWRRAGA